MQFKKWFEHFIILPLKWYKIHIKDWKEMNQRCKVCGCADKFDFQIKTETRKQVLPKEYHNRVVCLSCFDDFAKKKEIDYSTSLEALYFAGDKNGFDFKVVKSY